jgi:hypothetical protein
MTIKLHQTIHGYQNGHQLLASSTELTNGEKKLLLFQSDLSGPNVDDGFDQYLTGYPIAETGRYAFAKTWYAKEMKRPGCVWTHTLLINFSDLGRIPDFNIIEDLFIRPALNEYENYQQFVPLIVEDLITKSNSDLELNEDVQGMMEGLYMAPEKIAIIPAKNSEQYKKNTLDIWSDQWPRLRRNFTFCTGALSLRTIEEKPYDFQIVPQKSVPSIERKSPNIFISHHSSDNVDELVKILKEFPLNQRRKFLWTYGADVEGERKNYLPLLKIFETIYSPAADLKTISREIGNYFSDKGEARLLKSKLFGKESILLNRFTDLGIIHFLLSEEIDFVEFGELHIEERLLKLLTEHEISLSSFLEMWSEADHEKISLQFIDTLDIEPQELIASVSAYPELAGLLVKKLVPLASNPELWKLELNIQSAILSGILNSDHLNRDYVTAMLQAGSTIILELYEKIGNDIVLLSLKWLNSDKNISLNNEWAKEIADNPHLVRNWLKDTKDVSPSVHKFIFNYFTFGQIKKMDFSAQDLVSIYNNLKLPAQSQVFLTATIFSLGLDPKLKNGEAVIQLTFPALYRFAAASEIGKEYWSMIPKEVNYDNEDDDNHNPLFAFFYMMLPPRKKTSRVPAWDYCEILTRTVVNTYITRSWSKYSFITVLSDQEAFKKAVDYCQTFNAGIRFLLELLDELKGMKDNVSEYQKRILKVISIEE